MTPEQVRAFVREVMQAAERVMRKDNDGVCEGRSHDAQSGTSLVDAKPLCGPCLVDLNEQLRTQPSASAK